MPGPSQGVKRKRRGRPRSGTKRMRLIPNRRPQNLSRDIYYFKRYITNPETISGNAAHLPYLSGYSFNFGQLVNSGEYTALFDQYMITYIQVKWFLKIDPGAQAAAGATYPRLFVCRDYDDGDPPPTLNNLREHARTQVRVMNPNRPVTVGFKPAIASQIYNTPVAAGYGPKWKQWIDCNNPAVPHYGLKFAIDDLTNVNYRVTTEVQYWFRCRGTR